CKRAHPRDVTPAVMLIRPSFDRHEPHGAMCLSRDTVRAGRFLRGLQRIEAIDVPIYGLGQRPKQRPARQNRAALLPTPLRRILGALHRWPLNYRCQRRDHQGEENRTNHVPLLTLGADTAWANPSPMSTE